MMEWLFNQSKPTLPTNPYPNRLTNAYRSVIDYKVEALGEYYNITDKFTEITIDDTKEWTYFYHSYDYYNATFAITYTAQRDQLMFVSKVGSDYTITYTNGVTDTITEVTLSDGQEHTIVTDPLYPEVANASYRLLNRNGVLYYKTPLQSLVF